MNTYLVPANSKKSILILGLFRPLDLIVIAIGVVIFGIMVIILEMETLLDVVLALIPLMITVTLVSPMPNYHNVLQFLINTYNFFTNRRRYLWKGWSYKTDESE